jgi:hypothetical protein
MWKSVENAWKAIDFVVKLDARSLAAHRISLGLVLIWDLLDRFRDITALHSVFFSFSFIFLVQRVPSLHFTLFSRMTACCPVGC